MPTRVPIKVLLVDDNEIVRKGLLEAIEHPDDFTVVGETAIVKRCWFWRGDSSPT